MPEVALELETTGDAQWLEPIFEQGFFTGQSVLKRFGLDTSTMVGLVESWQLVEQNPGSYTMGTWIIGMDDVCVTGWGFVFLVFGVDAWVDLVLPSGIVSERSVGPSGDLLHVLSLFRFPLVTHKNTRGKNVGDCVEHDPLGELLEAVLLLLEGESREREAMEYSLTSGQVSTSHAFRRLIPRTKLLT